MISRSGREKILPLLLVGALFLCHGVFGLLHLVCASPECIDGAEHPAGHPSGHPAGQPAGHHSAAATMGHTHEHPVSHATSAEYFAVVVGLLGLLVGLLGKGTWQKARLGSRRTPTALRASAVFRPVRAPTSRVLQVFRL
jgi:hypothetical protein